MADDKLQQKLIDYIEDAHAMEQNVSTMLTSMISTTDDPEINALRQRQMRNFLSTLLLSQGTPMLLAGDEFARTQLPAHITTRSAASRWHA